MTITAAIVLFAVIWFMLLFISLPIGLKTQGDIGEVVPGTHASSPVNAQIKRKMKWVTLITILIFVPTYWVISTGMISVASLDFYSGIDKSY